MENNEYKILDEAINFLNTGNITLDHKNNFINTYDKLSHKEIKKNETGFYKFHDEIKNKINSILKQYKLSATLYGVFNNKNALQPTRICTIIINKGKLSEEDYNIQVAKLMNDYKGGKITSDLNKLSNKVKVIDANYCYTTTYRIYSIDITYTKE